MKMKKNDVIAIKPIVVKAARIRIEGAGDIVLNKMNARNTRAMVAKNEGRKIEREEPNKWEDIITAVHWKYPLETADGVRVNGEDTYRMCDEEMYHHLLETNKPCFTAFGLKKSLADAVVRNEIDTYSTKFNNAVNVVATGGLIPIDFGSAFVDERLMSPQKGSPVLARLNHFSNWSAEFDIQYTEGKFKVEDIVNIIKLAGFGLGIGSGRSSGNGRYHIVSVADISDAVEKIA